jgi:hypothetical protein
MWTEFAKYVEYEYIFLLGFGPFLVHIISKCKFQLFVIGPV